MLRIDLDTPFLEDGIRSTHFFNGRLLSAEDLSRDQEAHQLASQRLGRAIGEGIAHGLEVEPPPKEANTLSDPYVIVKRGVALNRLGEVMELGRELEVSLGGSSQQGPAARSANAGAFQRCETVKDTVGTGGAGVYLLVLCSARKKQGKVERNQVSGLGPHNQAPCDWKTVVEGVRFRLLKLELDPAPGDATKLRNRVAHLCFGTTDTKLQAQPSNFFGPAPTDYGLIDKLRKESKLTDCDVPLALLHWTPTEGLRFVDGWSVRRRPLRSEPTSRFTPLLSERRLLEREAMLLQFQEELEALREDSPFSVVASNHFHFLPPAGVIPLGASAAERGFDEEAFFQGLTLRNAAYIEGAQVEPLLRQSLSFPPIALGQQGFVWRYLVRENQEGYGSGAPLRYLVFASEHMPYFGDARFDVGRVDLASYALE
jgi:hypothetical protein